ncbi:MAG: hypothetical protein O9318_06985 [Hylemonella sp.]|uniref:hypothetical protein n=1 Tax=Hylemonella sp. TaxID=2066020 RepID=UPI0022C85339|nr:hypothetical protein [Hylemonella sp.]MCZ8252197.1 hypothetical protein [Hylemonella sp.]
MKTALALASALLLAAAAQAQTGESRCTQDFKAEQARIEREAMARAPAPGSDQATQQRFMQGVHAQLQAAAARAEACEAATRPQPGSAAAQAIAAKQQQCTDMAKRELDQIKLPPQPSFEQQRAYREAETRILDARMDCLRRAR